MQNPKPPFLIVPTWWIYANKLQVNKSWSINRGPRKACLSANTCDDVFLWKREMKSPASGTTLQWTEHDAGSNSKCPISVLVHLPCISFTLRGKQHPLWVHFSSCHQPICFPCLCAIASICHKYEKKELSHGNYRNVLFANRNRATGVSHCWNSSRCRD